MLSLKKMLSLGAVAVLTIGTIDLSLDLISAPSDIQVLLGTFILVAIPTTSFKLVKAILCK